MPKNTWQGKTPCFCTMKAVWGRLRCCHTVPVVGRRAATLGCAWAITMRSIGSHETWQLGLGLLSAAWGCCQGPPRAGHGPQPALLLLWCQSPVLGKNIPDIGAMAVPWDSELQSRWDGMGRDKMGWPDPMLAPCSVPLTAESDGKPEAAALRGCYNIVLCSCNLDREENKMGRLKWKLLLLIMLMKPVYQAAQRKWNI